MAVRWAPVFQITRFFTVCLCLCLAGVGVGCPHMRGNTLGTSCAPTAGPINLAVSVCWIICFCFPLAVFYFLCVFVCWGWGGLRMPGITSGRQSQFAGESLFDSHWLFWGYSLSESPVSFILSLCLCLPGLERVLPHVRNHLRHELCS